MMLVAVVFGALGVLTLCAVVWRGGSWRRWTFVGVLVLLVAAEAGWYGRIHGWPATHPHIGLVFMPAVLVGLACVGVGLVQSRRVRRKPRRGGS
jgi:hypothetical protein